MKWTKLGRIFDPVQHGLPLPSFGFAQGPHALVLADRVRIYFSTRERDPRSDKYLSHIAFVDMDRSLTHTLGVSEHIVIPLGRLGCFDEHGIFPIQVLKHDGRLVAYTCGWSRRVSVSVETAIGFAVSRDEGRTFEKLGDGPILTATVNEPFLVGDPFVLVHKGSWHMWYMFGTRWSLHGEPATPERTYKIGHAVSGDGLSWRRDGRQLIPDVFPEESQAHPTVFYHSGSFHMYFCYRHSVDFRNNPERGYRLGYACSTDLINWVRDDSSAGIGASEHGWDSEMQCYPATFELDGRIYLLYNGNEFGRHGFGLARLEPDT